MAQPPPSRVVFGWTWRQAAAVLGVVAFGIAVLEDGGESPPGLVWPLLLIAAGLLLLHGFVFRVPWLILVPGVVIGPSLLLFVDAAEGGMFFLCLVAVLVTVDLGHRRVAHVVAAGLAGIPILAGITAQPDAAWAFWSLGILLSWAFGYLGRHNRQLAAELEASRAQAADRAVLAERRRIARDIHDLLGHSITVVLLHITGARRAIRRDPESAEQALISAEQVGRDSLAEIRRSVGLLRTDDGADTQPSPGGSDIAQLIDDSRAAGQPIRYEASGDLTTVEGAVGLTAYRIVQESLSNAAKHAPGAAVMVELDVGDTECGIVVENRTTSPGADAPPIDGGGFGLVSMRERVRALGGSLVIGPAGNVWRVEATLPITHSTVAS